MSQFNLHSRPVIHIHVMVTYGSSRYVELVTSSTRPELFYVGGNVLHDFCVISNKRINLFTYSKKFRKCSHRRSSTLDRSETVVPIWSLTYGWRAKETWLVNDPISELWYKISFTFIGLRAYCLHLHRINRELYLVHDTKRLDSWINSIIKYRYVNNIAVVISNERNLRKLIIIIINSIYNDLR